MADKDANRPYTVDDLLAATKDLQHARDTLNDKKNQIKRHFDALKSFEKAEAEAHAEVIRFEHTVRKIAANLEKK